MVRRNRPTRPTRDRLLAAASEEFAARGFDGAKVDRIAAKARVNKAMLYYHFANKAALYREILRELFGAVAAAVSAVRATDDAPEIQIRAFATAIAQTALAHPQFPAIWLREIAEGGRHLDESIVAEITRVLQTLAAILANGRAAHVFRDVPPLIVQFGIVGPLLLAIATEPVRDRYRDRVPGTTVVGRTAMLEYVHVATLAALAPPSRPDRGRSPS